MSAQKLAEALRRIIVVTSATPSMTESMLGVAMGRIQEIAESTLALHDSRPTEIHGLSFDAEMPPEVASWLSAHPPKGVTALKSGAVQGVPDGWREAVALAYGHLWHVNNEPMAPVPLRSDGEASYAARKLLRDLLTSEERGTAINRVRTLLESPPPPSVADLSAAARDVLAERQRQISVEGWHPEHDDVHDACQLSHAAGMYAIYGNVSVYGPGNPPLDWPWDTKWWKPSATQRRNLVKAGALILAEIEREDRAAALGEKS